MTLGRTLCVLPYALLLAGILLPAAPPVRAGNKDYPIRPLNFTKVHVTDAFWAPRLETNRTVTFTPGARSSRRAMMSGPDRSGEKKGEGQSPSPFPLSRQKLTRAESLKVLMPDTDAILL